MKLSEYAKQYEISYRTAWNRFKKNLIPNAYKDEFGNIRISEHKQINLNVAIYARVSSNHQKEDLKQQSLRLQNYAISKGYQISLIVEEIGSGMNDKRPKLIKLLQDDNMNLIIVEHKDRLTRFGFNYIDQLLNIQNRKIEVVNIVDNQQNDIMQDLISIIYSFSARIYGKRRSKKKINSIIQDLKKVEK